MTAQSQLARWGGPAQPEKTAVKLIESGRNFARFAFGDISIVALRDGYVDMPASRLRQPQDRPFGADMPAKARLVDGQFRLSVNAFLVIDAGRHILIDTGAGNAWDPTMGLLHGALAEAGIERSAIDTVALTHTHTDHIAGLVADDGSDAFPTMRQLFVPREEVSAFDRKERVARFLPRCTLFGDGTRIGPSITTVQAHGHSPGHTMYEVVSAEKKLLIWGDIVHVPSIQFARPELTWEYDEDQEQARATRKRMLDLAAGPGVFVAGAHLDFPGVGRVTRSGEAYVFTDA
jgi:glyoxylase-like metal-dependent hydrolase (beta-lactamase superfamily II)